MSKLTKHNTALDLSKLTEGEKRELFKLISQVDDWSNWSEDRFVQDFCWNILRHDTGFDAIEVVERIDGVDKDWVFVDFQTFKSINFPEQEDKPTYEELVEALTVAVQVVDRPDIYNEIKQLLERIK